MRRSFCQASAREARQISVLGKWWRSLYWAKFSGQALQCLSMGPHSLPDYESPKLQSTDRHEMGLGVKGRGQTHLPT